MNHYTFLRIPRLTITVASVQCFGGKEIDFLFTCCTLIFRWQGMLTLRTTGKYTFRNLSVLNVPAGPVCSLLPTAYVLFSGR